MRRSPPGSLDAPDLGREIRFCEAAPGVRVAFATVGSGPALVSLALAARQPARVKRLVVHGGYADGRSVASPEVRAAMLDLVRAYWGLGSDVLADIFLPDGSTTMKAQFAELQRGSASADVACQLPPDRRAARDRGALGRGSRGADPPTARGCHPRAGRRVVDPVAGR